MAPAAITSPATFLPDDLKLNSILEPPKVAGPRLSASKVICTLGPACRNVDTLEAMINAGMSAARVDLTWGPPEYHVQSLRNLQEAMLRTKRLCATIVDTVGREVVVRTEHELDEEGWPIHTTVTHIEAGQEVRLTSDPNARLSGGCLPVTFPFEEICQQGDAFFVGRYLASGADDSSVWLEAKRVEGHEVICEANNSAELSGLLTVLHAERHGEGLNPTNLPLLSEHDTSAIRYIADRFPDLDFLALTFTRSGEDVEEARAMLHQLDLDHVKILAKVEDASALHEFDSILTAADGIVLSRGNLGLDVAPEKMARVQKCVISACNLLGKPVIMTRIVDTMDVSPRPTRAEATDVANAVLDGTDAFLLGAETLRGRFPVPTVSIVSAIAREAEVVFDHEAVYDNLIAIASQADEDADGHHQGQFLASPNESMASMPASPSPAMSGDNELAESSLPTAIPPHMRQANLNHGLPSTASLGRLHKLTDQNHIPESKSMLKLATDDIRRTQRLEAVASTGVRAAGKIGASLIITYSHSGRTASLVAKYRPSMPVVALMVPRLISSGQKWQLYGLSAARQLQIVRGVIPMLGAPMAGASDQLLAQAVGAAAARGLVGPDDHVVCILSQKDDLVVEALSVDSLGSGIKAAARESDDARSLASSEPPGCLAASSDNQSAGGSALPSAAGNPLLGKLDVSSTHGNGRNGSGSSPMGDALPHTSPLHAVSPTAGSREASGGDGNTSGAKGA
jgi:pyruvate kinase